MSLGPASFGEHTQYQYSIVTDRLQLTMFVLARDPKEFRKEFDTQVKDFLMKNGFDHFWNKPIVTLQSEECKYAPHKTSLYQNAEEYLDEMWINMEFVH